jgi:hypothetical protein
MGGWTVLEYAIAHPARQGAGSDLRDADRRGYRQAAPLMRGRRTPKKVATGLATASIRRWA